MANLTGLLKPGYSAFKYRELTLGININYLFQQRYGSSLANISIVNEDNTVTPLSANFAPSGSMSARGYPPRSLNMKVPQWSEHFRLALDLLEQWGGVQKFNELPYESHFFRRSDGQEVTAEEALMTY